jgi:hypothetical protein
MTLPLMTMINDSTPSIPRHLQDGGLHARRVVICCHDA